MAKLIHKNMPEPFTGDTSILGIEKHKINTWPTPGKIRDDKHIDIEKHDRPFEPYFGGGNQWGEDKHLDAGGGDRFSRSVNAFHGGTGLWGWPDEWAIEKGR